MNASQAQQEGMYFTGCYERDNDRPKTEAAAIRKLGYRAVVVFEPASKYSRGSHAGGYSVYAERRYSLDNSIKQLESELTHVEDRKANELEKYQDAIAQIEADALETTARLAEYKNRSEALLAESKKK